MPADGAQSPGSAKSGPSKPAVIAAGAAIVLAGLVLAWVSGSPPDSNPKMVTVSVPAASVAEIAPPPAKAKPDAEVTQVPDQSAQDNATGQERVEAVELSDSLSEALEEVTLETAAEPETGLIKRVISQFAASGESVDIERCEEIRRVADASCEQQLFANQEGPAELCVARELRYTLWSTYGCQ